MYMGEINDIGGICLSLFLGMAMITLKIWQLAELALPLMVLLAGQTLFMILYAVAIVFNVMGRDYDAAVIVSGTCGFGMGATPNAMANMQAVCDKYSPSVKAYLLIPLVGSLFADFHEQPGHYGIHQLYLMLILTLSGGPPHRERRRAMSLKHHLKMWLEQKIGSNPHEEETVALPEIHTGKGLIRCGRTPAAEDDHYDNGYPGVHLTRGAITPIAKNE